MRRTVVKAVSLAAVMALCLVCVSGCGFVKSSFSKLNDRIEEVGTAAAALSTEAVREPQVQVKNDGDNSVTVLVYMNGSNLESEAGEASNDLQEMVKAGSSDNVKVIVQTMGTSSWQTKGISSKKTQRFEVTADGLKCVDNSLKQLACTESSTLEDFIKWGAKNYPAERYELIFWDHGAGPVYGFGYDETGDEDDTLTLDEMQRALKNAGVYFDFIGMDCCIMSSLETCCALYDYCDYTILSEDFESGLGWYYTGWLADLYKNPTISTKTLGKTICDDTVKENKRDKDWGDKSTLALIDQSMMKVLFTAWVDFAYANEDTLLNQNYSTSVAPARGGRDSLMGVQKGFFSDFYDYTMNGLFSDEESYDMADYYVTDIMATAQNIDSTESKALAAALKDAIIYYASYNESDTLTGLSVTLPYGDYEFYTELKKVFTNCGFDSQYIAWLEQFAGTSGSYDFADWSVWSSIWDGWDDVDSNFDWNSWGNSHSDSTLDNNSSGWSQYSYEDSWNKWFEDNYFNYQPGQGGGPSGYGR